MAKSDEYEKYDPSQPETCSKRCLVTEIIRLETLLSAEKAKYEKLVEGLREVKVLADKFVEHVIQQSKGE